MVTKTVFKQIRGFVIVWLFVTALVCMATFLAVYFTYNPEQISDAASNRLPLETPESESEVVEASPAPASVTPEPPDSPTEAPPTLSEPETVGAATDLPAATN